MEWDESLFALPSPALSGSGDVGMISALNIKAPHCINNDCKVKTDF